MREGVPVREGGGILSFRPVGAGGGGGSCSGGLRLPAKKRTDPSGPGREETDDLLTYGGFNKIGKKLVGPEGKTRWGVRGEKVVFEAA